jgi:diadenosine tetraphosphate (Ap4A) HIT family hydrolase
MGEFHLDRRLEADSFEVCQLGLCHVRLMNNKQFPWLLLIPDVANASEWIDLTREQQHRLSDEIMISSHMLQALVTPDKLNIATLGNQVRQLHVHVIARYMKDTAWPNPVWGQGSTPYDTKEAEQFCYELRSGFAAVGM